MKKYVLLVFSCTLLFACSRKSVPPKGTNATIVPGNTTQPTTNNATNNNSGVVTEPLTPDTVAAAKNLNALSFIVVSDAYGKIVTEEDSLPAEANVQYNQLELSKGFTAQQLINLKTRYKTIPPRVIYVNPQKQISSPRGTYYILGNKKFWYWKRKDGLFYLDNKYYL